MSLPPQVIADLEAAGNDVREPVAIVEAGDMARLIDVINKYSADELAITLVAAVSTVWSLMHGPLSNR